MVFSFGLPIWTPVGETAIWERSLPGSIIFIQEKGSEERLVPLFTDSDLAQRIIDDRPMPGVKTLSLKSPLLLRGLIADLAARWDSTCSCRTAMFRFAVFFLVVAFAAGCHRANEHKKAAVPADDKGLPDIQSITKKLKLVNIPDRQFFAGMEKDRVEFMAEWGSKIEENKRQMEKLQKDVVGKRFSGRGMISERQPTTDSIMMVIYDRDSVMLTLEWPRKMAMLLSMAIQFSSLMK